MCSRCKDLGYYGGRLDGPYAGPWRWCNCPASFEVQSRDAGLVDAANAAREKLLAMGKKSVQVRGGDDYRGDF